MCKRFMMCLIKGLRLQQCAFVFDIAMEEKEKADTAKMLAPSTNNIPSGQQVQQFMFKGDEARHALGEKHKKRLELLTRPGIKKIDLIKRVNESDKIKQPSKKSKERCIGFKIEGEPTAVDSLMTEISTYLKEIKLASKLQQIRETVQLKQKQETPKLNQVPKVKKVREQEWRVPQVHKIRGVRQTKTYEQDYYQQMFGMNSEQLEQLNQQQDLYGQQEEQDDDYLYRQPYLDDDQEQEEQQQLYQQEQDEDEIYFQNRHILSQQDEEQYPDPDEDYEHPNYDQDMYEHDNDDDYEY